VARASTTSLSRRLSACIASKPAWRAFDFHFTSSLRHCTGGSTDTPNPGKNRSKFLYNNTSNLVCCAKAHALMKGPLSALLVFFASLQIFSITQMTELTSSSLPASIPEPRVEVARLAKAKMMASGTHGWKLLRHRRRWHGIRQTEIQLAAGFTLQDRAGHVAH